MAIKKMMGSKYIYFFSNMQELILMTFIANQLHIQAKSFMWLLKGYFNRRNNTKKSTIYPTSLLYHPPLPLPPHLYIPLKK